MPKKKEFETDLKNVNIRRKDYNTINQLRYSNEPFYSVFQRVIKLLNQEHADYLEEMEILRETMRTWQKRALEAEGYQRKLL